MCLRATSKRCSFGVPRSSRPKATLRKTLAQGSKAKSWKTKARSGPGPSTFFPFTQTSPLLGGYQSGDDFKERCLTAPAGAQKRAEPAAGKP